MARATADRALAHGLLKPELAEDLLGALADGPGDDREPPDDRHSLPTAGDLAAAVADAVPGRGRASS